MKILIYSGLPTSRLQSEISDFLLYRRLYYYFFLDMLKTETFFAHPITKQPASTLELKNFDFTLQENFCDSRQKRQKLLHPAGFYCAWAGLWPVVTLREVSRLFWNTMLTTQVPMSTN